MTPNSLSSSRRCRRRYADMDALEKGAIANPDEKRMVGHYWLRAPELAPTPEIAHGDPRDARRASRRSPPTCTPATIKPPKAARFTQRPLDRHRRLGARARVRRRRARRSGDRQDGGPLHRQHRPGRHRPRARRGWTASSPRRSSWSSARAAARRRRATACSWPPTPIERPGSTSPSTPSPSPAPARSWTSRPSRRLAGALPDVGLGRRPHQRDCRPVGLAARGAAGIDIDAHARRRRGLRRRRPAATTPRRTPPPCWP